MHMEPWKDLFIIQKLYDLCFFSERNWWFDQGDTKQWNDCVQGQGWERGPSVWTDKVRADFMEEVGLPGSWKDNKLWARLKAFPNRGTQEWSHGKEVCERMLTWPGDRVVYKKEGWMKLISQPMQHKRARRDLRGGWSHFFAPEWECLLVSPCTPQLATEDTWVCRHIVAPFRNSRRHKTRGFRGHSGSDHKWWGSWCTTV